MAVSIFSVLNYLCVFSISCLGSRSALSHLSCQHYSTTEKSIFKIQQGFYSVYSTIVNKCHILVLFSEKPKCFHQNVYNMDTSK